MNDPALLVCSSAVRKPEAERAKQVADREAGADCKRILKAAASSRSASAAVKQRFREGSIDEVSFLGGLLKPSNLAVGEILRCPMTCVSVPACKMCAPLETACCA